MRTGRIVGDQDQLVSQLAERRAGFERYVQLVMNDCAILADRKQLGLEIRILANEAGNRRASLAVVDQRHPQFLLRSLIDRTKIGFPGIEKHVGIDERLDANDGLSKSRLVEGDRELDLLVVSDLAR